MTPRHRFATALLLLCGAGLGAQAPATPPSGLLVGRVVDGDTNQPVAAAVVTLTTAAPGGAASNPADELMFAPAANAPPRLVADSSGRFVFRDLPRGRFNVAATAAGYLAGLAGQSRPAGPWLTVELNPNEKLRDVTIRLWKPAAINGTLTDEAGEPAAGIQVRLMRRSMASGTPRWTAASSASADDRGVFRIAGLTPGDYILGVTATQTTIPAALSPADGPRLVREIASSGSGLNPMSSGFLVDNMLFVMGPFPGRSIPLAMPPPVPAENGRMLVYQNAFYPGATNAAQAGVLTLRPGEDRAGVDLQLRLGPGVRVTGTVSGPAGPAAGYLVRLVPASLESFAAESGLDVANSLTDARGGFVFLGVPAGDYVFKTAKIPLPGAQGQGPLAEGIGASPAIGGSGGVSFGMTPPSGPAPPPAVSNVPTFYASQPLPVGDADVSGVAVSLKTGAQLGGRVEFAGAGNPPTADQIQRMSITLNPVGTRPMLNGGVGRATPDGQFRTPGYLPGLYVIGASAPAPGWTLVSAMLNGKDVSDEPLTLDAADIAGIVLTFSDRPTALSGVVRDAQGRPDADADVIAFPANHTAWKQFGVTPRRAARVRTSKDGAYSLATLPPGDYFVAAVNVERGPAGAEWQDPKFLDLLIRDAVRVTLAGGEPRTAELQTSGVR